VLNQIPKNLGYIEIKKKEKKNQREEIHKLEEEIIFIKNHIKFFKSLNLT